MTTFEWLSFVLNLFALLVAGYVACTGIYHLKHLVQQVRAAVRANRLSQFNGLLFLETIISNARREYNQASLDLDRVDNETDEKDYKTAKLNFEEAEEVYLNSIDRLCVSIDRGLLNEDELRHDYQNYVVGIVEKLKPDALKEGKFRNIQKIYEKWKKETA